MATEKKENCTVGTMLPQVPISEPVLKKEETIKQDNTPDEYELLMDKIKKDADKDNKPDNEPMFDEYDEMTIDINTYPVPAGVALLLLAAILSELANIAQIGIDKLSTPSVHSSYRKILDKYHKLFIGDKAPNFDTLKKNKLYVKNDSKATSAIIGRLKKYGLGLDYYVIEYNDENGDNVCHGQIRKKFLSLALATPTTKSLKQSARKYFVSTTDSKYKKYELYYNCCIGVDNNIFTDDVKSFLIKCKQECDAFKDKLEAENKEVKSMTESEKKLIAIYKNGVENPVEDFSFESAEDDTTITDDPSVGVAEELATINRDKLKDDTKMGEIQHKINIYEVTINDCKNKIAENLNKIKKTAEPKEIARLDRLISDLRTRLSTYERLLAAERNNLKAIEDKHSVARPSRPMPIAASTDDVLKDGMLDYLASLAESTDVAKEEVVPTEEADTKEVEERTKFFESVDTMFADMFNESSATSGLTDTVNQVTDIKDIDEFEEAEDESAAARLNEILEE